MKYRVHATDSKRVRDKAALLKKFLSGRMPGKLYDKFSSRLVAEILRLNQKEFDEHSKGKGKLEPPWIPHAPRTVKYRNSQSFSRKYPGVNPRHLLVRSLALRESVGPGKTVGNRYIPAKNQTVKIVGSSITIESTLDYAKRIAKSRNIFFAADIVMDRAIKTVLDEMLPDIIRFLTTYER